MKMFMAEIWSVARTNQGNAVLLRPRGLEIAVPIFIGQLEMHSILIGREAVSLPRPLTHDLFLNVLNHINLSLKRVEIHELRDNTFHARIIITGGEFTPEKPLILDSRASDAFALAVRRRCPIYIAAEVAEQAGIPLDFFIETMEEAAEDEEPYTPGSGVDIHRRILLEQLNRAVAVEEYERAAELRDMLKLLEKEEKQNF